VLTAGKLCETGSTSSTFGVVEGVLN
jgi:hypothetical protein